MKDLAATYSRGAYRTTTIGKTVFDGRVRKGNGSDHSFITTKNRATEIRAGGQAEPTGTVKVLKNKPEPAIL